MTNHLFEHDPPPPANETTQLQWMAEGP